MLERQGQARPSEPPSASTAASDRPGTGRTTGSGSLPARQQHGMPDRDAVASSVT